MKFIISLAVSILLISTTVTFASAKDVCQLVETEKKEKICKCGSPPVEKIGWCYALRTPTGNFCYWECDNCDDVCSQ